MSEENNIYKGMLPMHQFVPCIQQISQPVGLVITLDLA